MTRTYVKTDIITIFDANTGKLRIYAQDFGADSTPEMQEDIDLMATAIVPGFVFDFAFMRRFDTMHAFTMWLFNESCVVENSIVVAIPRKIH